MNDKRKNLFFTGLVGLLLPSSVPFRSNCKYVGTLSLDSEADRISQAKMEEVG